MWLKFKGQEPHVQINGVCRPTWTHCAVASVCSSLLSLTLISLTVAKQSFYAGYLVMSIFVEWEGWHCSKISSFFAHYKHEASSTWTYTMCFQVLFRRMARYMGLLRGNQTSFYLSHGWYCQYRSPDAKVFCSKVLSDRPFLYSHPLQRKRHASHQHLVREGLREFCHGYWLQPDRWRHDRILSGNFRHSKRQTTEQNLSLIHIWRCRRIERCRSRWSPYH